MAEFNGLTGPPDIINHVQALDLVNTVERPAVVNLDNLNMLSVDIVEDLPDTVVDNTPINNGDDLEGDRLDAIASPASWFSRGKASAGVSQGIQMPTEKDADHYNMGHRRRGKAYIFNHMHFDSRLQLKARNGTNNDRDNLRVCLRELDFDVEVHNDLPFRDLERILEQASMEDHSDSDCILVMVMSHGEVGILYACDQPYKPDRLWSLFHADKCPSLAGKPKLFFIQAGRGDQLDQGTGMQRTETDACSTTYRVPNHADFLIAYSTIPGFCTWRSTTEGSWFVQALVHILQSEAHTRDLLSMMTRVIRKVAYDFESNVPGDYGMHMKKQIPSVTSMLTRDLLFTRK